MCLSKNSESECYWTMNTALDIEWFRGIDSKWMITLAKLYVYILIHMYVHRISTTAEKSFMAWPSGLLVTGSVTQSSGYHTAETLADCVICVEKISMYCIMKLGNKRISNSSAPNIFYNTENFVLVEWCMLLYQYYINHNVSIPTNKLHRGLAIGIIHIIKYLPVIICRWFSYLKLSLFMN